MKKLINILILIAFTGAGNVFAQVKGDFSDWNVPPPIPPGSISKGSVTKATILLPPTDVQAFDVTLANNIKLAALSPVLHKSPIVDVPDQPEFPLLPFKTPDIPLPVVPDAIDPPREAPQDAVNDISLDIPSPPVPEMPEIPKMPDVIPDKSPDISLKLPIMPGILQQPVPGIIKSGMDFPFDEWPAPPIPSNSNFERTIPANPVKEIVTPGVKKKNLKKRVHK